jgi:hypothetical protein
MSIQSFGPRGNTANISCSATASTSEQITSAPNNCFTYQFMNIGAAKCFFAYSTQPGVVAQIPTPGNPKPSTCVLPNEIVVYNLQPNVWISAICETGATTNLLITPGEGN